MLYHNSSPQPIYLTSALSPGFSHEVYLLLGVYHRNAHSLVELRVYVGLPYLFLDEEFVII